MGIRVSVHNDTKCKLKIYGDIRMMGGGKLHGWDFALRRGEKFSKQDQGIAASCWYQITVYVPTEGTSEVLKYWKVFQTTAVKGTKNLFITDIIRDGKMERIENKEVVSKDCRVLKSESLGNPRSIYGRQAVKNPDVVVHPYLQPLNERINRFWTPAVQERVVEILWPENYLDRLKQATLAILLVFLSLPVLGPWIFRAFILALKLLVFLFNMALAQLSTPIILVIATIFLYVFSPRLLGMLLTNILYYTALNKHPLVFYAIHVQPWMNDFRELHLQVKAEGVKFGNPRKEFKDNPWFLTCRWVDFRATISTEDILNLMMNFNKTEWSPFPSMHSHSKRAKEGGLTLQFFVRDLPRTPKKSGKMYVKMEHCGQQIYKSEVVPAVTDFRFQEVYIKYRDVPKYQEVPLIITVMVQKGLIGFSTLGTLAIELDELRAIEVSPAALEGLPIYLDLKNRDGECLYGDPEVTEQVKVAQKSCVGIRFQSSKDAKRISHLSLVNFHNINLEGVTIQFAMSKGLFNINGFTRDLANGECERGVRRVLGPGKWPNTLRVRILRCRDLGGRKDKPPNVRVSVTVRQKHATTRLHAGNYSPIIDESIEFHNVTDASSVLHVQVHDEELLSGDVLGQWVMTLKWIYLNPFFNHHHSMELAEGHTLRGWFPLLGPDMDTGNNGEIEMWIQWAYTEEGIQEKPKNLTALQQLTENSAETTLRLGNVDNVMRMLRRFPALMNVKRVIIRDVEFYLKDLFRGEVKNSERREAVKIPELSVNNFRRPTGANGIVLKDFLKQFAIGIIRDIQGKTVGSALMQVLGGIFSGFSKLFAKPKMEMFKHHEGWSAFNQKLGQLFHNPNMHLMLLAYDNDYWRPITLKGRLLIKTGLKWRDNLAEFKGNTLFFWRTDGKVKKSISRKVDFGMVTSIEYDDSGYDTIKLRHYGMKDTISIRVAKDNAKPTLREWETTFRVFRQRTLRKCIVIRVLSAEELPKMDLNGSADPYCIVRLKTKPSLDHEGCNLALPQKSSIHRHTRNPVFNEFFHLYPVPSSADHVEITFYDADKISKDDLIGSVKISVKDIEAHDNPKSARHRTLNLLDEDGSNVGSVTLTACLLENKAYVRDGKVRIVIDNKESFSISQKEDNDGEEKLSAGALQKKIQDRLRGLRTPRGMKSPDMSNSAVVDSSRPEHRRSLSEHVDNAAGIIMSPSTPSSQHEPIRTRSSGPNRSLHHLDDFEVKTHARKERISTIGTAIGDVQSLIMADKILRILDKDDNRRLSENELKPLEDIPDSAVLDTFNAYFKRAGLGGLDAKTMKGINARKLKDLLGPKLSIVHEHLRQKQEALENDASSENASSEKASDGISPADSKHGNNKEEDPVKSDEESGEEHKKEDYI
mmetsp:Transcript_911/g.2052  ORF Transcript_911/g.2052 Transcript_911/m.2052 type:complete len:1379 (+) Transcript_911:271-4407(+)